MTDPQELDRTDPLAQYRQQFVGADTPLVYFDGNSLGPPADEDRARGWPSSSTASGGPG